MSYDIYIKDRSGEVMRSDKPHFIRGGNYAKRGTTMAWLNITYNYAPIFREHFGPKGIRWLYGQRVTDTIPALTEIIDTLKDDNDDNYWNPTEGNARLALINLRTLAGMFPEGVWDGD